jgi:hypothetical protein
MQGAWCKEEIDLDHEFKRLETALESALFRGSQSVCFININCTYSSILIHFLLPCNKNVVLFLFIIYCNDST